MSDRQQQQKYFLNINTRIGPLLFLIYINDLHNAINNSFVYHFADDTNMNINASTEKIQKQVNQDLKSLYKWLLANKISLNCSKIELIVFRKSGDKPIQNIKIKINGHKLSNSEYIKYLGIYLDETLSGENHCIILANKLRQANGMFSKIRHYVPVEELKSIYYAIFSSHMIYGCQVWGQNRSAHMIKISKFQNRALRIINFKNFNGSVDILYKNNKILNVKDLIKFQNILHVHAYLNNVLPECFNDYYFRLNHIYFDTYEKFSTRMLIHSL